jgi:CDP-glucose 4,6-dehydratase
MSQLLASFYRGKRVLVTGHTGFTGGWLVSWLKFLDAKVCGYGLPPVSRPNFFDATLLDRGIRSAFADIRDREALANTFADFQPEIVFHAATQDNADGAQNDSIGLFETNVLGTLNLLEETQLTDCTRAIVVISDSQRPEYPAKNHWHGSTQTIARESALAFAGAFFPGTSATIAIPRFPALIGGGDWSESRLCGRLVHALTSGEHITIRNTPFTCLHVLEAVSACLHLAQQLFISRSAVLGSWDFSGYQKEVSEVEIAKQFAALCPSEDLQTEIQAREAVTHDVEPSTASVPQYAGWKSALSLDDAIAWTADWYKAYLSDPASAWRTTESQIANYSALPSN